jgi:hypothetical protein
VLLAALTRHEREYLQVDLVLLEIDRRHARDLREEARHLPPTREAREKDFRRIVRRRIVRTSSDSQHAPRGTGGELLVRRRAAVAVDDRARFGFRRLGPQRERRTQDRPPTEAPNGDDGLLSEARRHAPLEVRARVSEGMPRRLSLAGADRSIGEADDELGLGLQPRLRIALEEGHAEEHALVADVRGGACDQLRDVDLALPAERAT